MIMMVALFIVHYLVKYNMYVILMKLVKRPL